MSQKTIKSRKGFSLIELVIVVVIIGIIAAIAIPKMSRGAAGAGDSALSGNLSVLRNAIELYNAEHGAFPTGADVVAQLTQYSDASGGTITSKTGTHIYGPYLRKIPQLPVGKGAKKGNAEIGVSAAPAGPAGFTFPLNGTAGWVYFEKTGDIRANLADDDTTASGSAIYNQF